MRYFKYRVSASHNIDIVIGYVQAPSLLSAMMDISQQVGFVKATDVFIMVNEITEQEYNHEATPRNVE